MSLSGEGLHLSLYIDKRAQRYTDLRLCVKRETCVGLGIRYHGEAAPFHVTGVLDGSTVAQWNKSYPTFAIDKWDSITNVNYQTDSRTVNNEFRHALSLTICFSKYIPMKEGDTATPAEIEQLDNRFKWNFRSLANPPPTGPKEESIARTPSLQSLSTEGVAKRPRVGDVGKRARSAHGRLGSAAIQAKPAGEVEERFRDSRALQTAERMEFGDGEKPLGYTSSWENFEKQDKLNWTYKVLSGMATHTATALYLKWRELKNLPDPWSFDTSWERIEYTMDLGRFIDKAKHGHLSGFIDKAGTAELLADFICPVKKEDFQDDSPAPPDLKDVIHPPKPVVPRPPALRDRVARCRRGPLAARYPPRSPPPPVRGRRPRT